MIGPALRKLALRLTGLCLMGSLVMGPLEGGAAAAAEPKPSEPSVPPNAQDAPVMGYDSKGKRDPFVPLVRDGRLVGVASETPTTVSTAPPHLLGILWDPAGHSIALIDNTEVKVGEMVGPYRVTDIRKDAVVLEGEGNTLVLQITFDKENAAQQEVKDREH